jgi:homeobox protein cut-like
VSSCPQERLAALEREKETLVTKMQHDAADASAASAGGLASAAAANIEETLRLELGVQRELAFRLRSELVGH